MLEKCIYLNVSNCFVIVDGSTKSLINGASAYLILVHQWQQKTRTRGKRASFAT